jgi:hypothetical protein
MNNMISETLKALIVKQAWDELSGDSSFTWVPQMIDRHVKEINWEELSGNSGVYWNVETVSKYKDLIFWESLSRNLFDNDSKVLFSNHLEIVRKFSDMVDWQALSSSDLPGNKKYLKEFSDRWDWKEISGNRSIKWNDELFNEYIDKILPYYSDSCRYNSPWSQILNMEKSELKAKLLNEA